MLHELGIHLGDLFEHIRMCHEQFALFDESTHDMDAHFHGFGAAQHIGGHEGPVLGEGVGAGLGKLEAGEVVTNCDHLLLFRLGEQKKKFLRETVGIALHSLVEGFRGHAVDGGEVGVQYNFLSSNGEDERIESGWVRRERFHRQKNTPRLGKASDPRSVTVGFIFWRASVLFQQTRRTAEDGCRVGPGR